MGGEENTKIFRLLLEKGAKIGTNSEGLTELHWAATHKNIKAATMTPDTNQALSPTATPTYS